MAAGPLQLDLPNLSALPKAPQADPERVRSEAKTFAQSSTAAILRIGRKESYPDVLEEAERALASFSRGLDSKTAEMGITFPKQLSAHLGKDFSAEGMNYPFLVEQEYVVPVLRLLRARLTS